MILCDYGLTPEYVNQNWTEELLTLIFAKRNERIRKLNDMIAPPTESKSKSKRVLDTELFAMMGLGTT